MIKTFTKQNFKTNPLWIRLLIMAFMLLAGAGNVWGDNITGGITFYLKPNNVFDKEGNPWFAIYLCNGTAESKWIKMTQVTGESGLYEATVPDTGDKYHANVIFCRMNPSCTELKWDCRWNQTADLTYSNNKNLFTVTGWSNSQGTGNWSQKTLYYLMGLTDWVHGDNLSSSVSKNLAVGTHNFKVRDSQGNWYGNNGTMTRNGTSVQSGGWTMSTNEGNCGITADVAGDYTFTFNATTKKLKVTYPELPCYTTSDVDPGTISSDATNNTICGSGSVELTLTNTTSKDDLTRTIQWQKYIGSEWSNITNAISTTYYTETISATTKYRAKVTWTKSECTTLTEYASESGFTITVNARPSAPTNLGSATICKGETATLPEVTGSWYADANTITPLASREVEPEETKSYFATSKSNNCESSLRTEYVVTVKSLADANNYELTKTSEDYTGTTITLQTSDVNVNNNAGAVESIYFKQNGSNVTPINVGDYEVYVTTAATNDICAGNIKIGTFEITCPPIAAPAITKSATVCEGNPVTLSNYNGVNDNTVKWYSNSACTSEVTEQVILTDDKEYYAKAYHAASGCYSSEYSTLTFTVNPLPTITSISASNDEPVPFEDVVLTADGVTPGAEVKWYLGTDDTSVATGTTYTVTYATAGEVIVKAKAFLNGCESATTKTVAFSAEDCNSTTTTEQQTVGKTKIIVDNPQNWSTMKCYAWRTSDNKKILGEWSGTNMNKNGNNYEIVIDFAEKGISESDKIQVIFNNGSSQTVDSDEVSCNKIYRFSIGSKSGDKYSFTSQAADIDPYTEPVEITVDPEIKAPAVKMISAEYDEENDVIVAKGAVYKTGCGVTFWGFQYSKDGQTWGGKNEDYIRPISGNSLTVPGEFDYSFTIPNAGGGDIYYIRAYALNNYNNDDYNLSSAVYSTTSLPVEIPSKTINSATISLVDSEGEESVDTEVCPQSTVYLKVSYDGGDFKDYEAADNFPGTNLELVNHDKAHNYAIFSYTATATGVANITISNDNTSVTTTNGVNITLIDVTPVNAPMISISQATICEDGSATITVNNPIANLTYTLYKETEQIGDPVNYQTDDLTFNVTEAASYTVRAEESICNNYANSMPVELKVVTSDVKIGLAVDNNTVNPWQPLKLTVTPPEGYAYTIDGLADVVYTQSGDVYTIKIPRPADWSKGNSGDPVKTKPITFSAKIQVTDDLTCGTSSVNVTLADTEENCK